MKNNNIGQNSETMKSKKRTVIARVCITIISITVIILIVFVCPSIYEEQCKSRVYSDMESALDSVASANIRIIPVSKEVDENSEVIRYSPGASGVIFDCHDETFYALAAEGCRH